VGVRIGIYRNVCFCKDMLIHSCPFLARLVKCFRNCTRALVRTVQAAEHHSRIGALSCASLGVLARTAGRAHLTMHRWCGLLNLPPRWL
jgi:hypothetical protein